MSKKESPGVLIALTRLAVFCVKIKLPVIGWEFFWVSCNVSIYPGVFRVSGLHDSKGEPLKERNTRMIIALFFVLSTVFCAEKMQN